MDAIGELDLEWTLGYNGGEVCYVKPGVLCYKCGNSIKFYEGGEERAFSCPVEGIGPLTVHPHNPHFAFADTDVNPSIFVYEYPSLERVATLEHGAALEFFALKFSHSHYMASISGVPNCKLIVWNYMTGTQLTKCSMSHSPPNCLTFNPANWRQLCTSSEHEVCLWDIEQNNDAYIMKMKKVKLPEHDAEVGPVGQVVTAEARVDAASRASSHLARSTVVVPHEAVAGVMRTEMEQFASYEDVALHVSPAAHCWNPMGEAYIGCHGGQLIKVDAETDAITILLNDNAISKDALSKETSHASFGVASMMRRDTTSISLDGCLNVLLLHSKALYSGGSDGILRCLHISPKGAVTVNSMRSFDAAIMSLNFEPGFHRIVVGTANGSLFLVSTDLDECEELFSLHHGDFIAVDMLFPGSQHTVTLREDGELQIWDVETAKMTGSISLGYQVTSLACSPLSCMIAVGTACGQLCILDATKVDSPRTVHYERLHRGPLSHLAFSLSGMFLLTASTDGHAFVLDGRASFNWRVLGHTGVPRQLRSVAVHTSERNYNTTTVVITAAGNGDEPQSPATHVVQFQLPRDLMDDLESKWETLKGDFKDDVIAKVSHDLSKPSYGMAVTDHNQIYTICRKTRRIQKIHLPRSHPMRELSTDSLDDAPLTATEEFAGHELQGGLLKLSPHHKWLATAGTDGRLIVRVLKYPEQTIKVNAHDFHCGGVRGVGFTSDLCRILTTGYDGTLSCYKWKWTSMGEAQAKKAVDEAVEHRERLNALSTDENEQLARLSDEGRPPSSASGSVAPHSEVSEAKKASDGTAAPDEDDENRFKSPPPQPLNQATVLEIKEQQALIGESQEYGELKQTLRKDIQEMRKKLQAMMKENNSVPDIEKLTHDEFELDMEAQARIQAQGDAQVKQIREQKEFDNLAKLYLTDLIRKECWDNMQVKGRGLLTFSKNLEVYNYPMRERTEQELAILEMVTEQRNVEMEELAARQEIVEMPSKSTIVSKVKKEEVDADAADPGGEEAVPDPDDFEADAKETPSVTGSLASAYGGGNNLLYSQFELYTRQQKMNHIVFLEDAIHRLQEAFNTEFNEVFEKKEQEIAKLKEKNKRIRKIMDDLGIDQEIEDPEMASIEKPEMLLVVKDSEVTVEKYLTPEEQKNAAAAAAAEEERRRREMGDNWRERGLDQMMGGVLEMKKEDELKKDIPIPSFMLTKPGEEWTDEEIKASQEYEAKVAELEEEREKYKKQLDMELKKLQAFTSETMAAFDEAVLELFRHKIKVEMCIYQEELKILRLRNSLLFEEEMHNQEIQLSEQIEYKRECKLQTTLAVVEAKKQVEAFREQYEIIVAEDKVMEKAFKRELHDVSPALLEQLHKVFRRRPRGQRVRASDTQLFEAAAGDPFGGRPSTARQEEAASASLQQAMAELDKYANAPEGLPHDVWRRVCALRRQKIDSEHLVKQKALMLAEMQAFLQKRQDEDEELKQEIDDLVASYNKLKEDQARSTINLEVQLVMKQGQVEVNPSSFIPNYTGCLLLHRSVVEDLNSKIRQLGEIKINNMVESKDFRKGIIQLEWDHQRMTMEKEDLQNKIRDIQSMKVTREIQAYLYDDNHEAKRAQEIVTLEQTAVKVKEQHERQVKKRRMMILEYRRLTKEHADENNILADGIQEMNIAVNERRNISQVTAAEDNERDRAARYADIVQRSRLVEVAKQQAQEVAILRAEVERLRMRTFPALVHVER